MAGYDNYAVPTFGAPSSGTAGPSSTSTHNGTSNTTSSQNSTATTKTNETSNQSIQSNTQNMSDASLAALDALIAQLANGGTPEQKRKQAQQEAAIAAAQAQIANYSKGAAFGDARGAMAASTQAALDMIMPSITRSAEGAGTSRNSMRALLEQNAAAKAAEGAATIGINAASNYGQVANGISATLAQLVSMKDPIADSLLAALGISKGSIQNSTQNTTNTRDLNSTTNTITNGNSSTNSQDITNNTSTVPAGASGLAPGSLGSTPTLGTKFGAPKPTTGFNPNDLLMSFGPLKDTTISSGLNGTSYGRSGESIANYLGLPPSSDFSDSFSMIG